MTNLTVAVYSFLNLYL